MPGRFRVRVNRRWHDGPEGEMVFLDMVQISVLVGMLANGDKLSLPPKPDLPKRSRVGVPNGKMLAGEPLYESSLTHTEPMIGYDGRW